MSENPAMNAKIAQPDGKSPAKSETIPAALPINIRGRFFFAAPRRKIQS
jgi:hypothetical protein